MIAKFNTCILPSIQRYLVNLRKGNKTHLGENNFKTKSFLQKENKKLKKIKTKIANW